MSEQAALTYDIVVQTENEAGEVVSKAMAFDISVKIPSEDEVFSAARAIKKTNENEPGFKAVLVRRRMGVRTEAVIGKGHVQSVEVITTSTFSI